MNGLQAGDQHGQLGAGFLRREVVRRLRRAAGQGFASLRPSGVGSACRGGALVVCGGLEDQGGVVVGVVGRGHGRHQAGDVVAAARARKLAGNVQAPGEGWGSQGQAIFVQLAQRGEDDGVRIAGEVGGAQRARGNQSSGFGQELAEQRLLGFNGVKL